MIIEGNGRFSTILKNYSSGAHTYTHTYIHTHTYTHTLIAYQTFKTMGIVPNAVCIQPRLTLIEPR